MIFPTLIHGDCLAEMLELPANCIDLILCDLPYGATQCEWDIPIRFDDLWAGYQHILKSNGTVILFGQGKFSAEAILSAPIKFPYKYTTIWNKNKVTGFLNSKKRPMNAHEDILIFQGISPVYNPQKTQGHKPVNKATRKAKGQDFYGATKEDCSYGGETERFPRSVINFPIVNNDDPNRTHKTQKPVELLRYLIRTYSNYGDAVMDNCMGTGSTGVACYDEDRQFLGIEMNEGFFDIAENKIISLYDSIFV